MRTIPINKAVFICLAAILFIFSPQWVSAQKKGKKVVQEPGSYTSLEDALKADPMKVFKLDLTKKKLKVFPQEIFVFKNLMQLNISNNKLTELPANLGELQKLTYLDISNNKIIQLPESMGNLKMLNSFKMSQNKIEKLPVSFFRLTTLEIIDFYSNPLSFDPQQFSKISKKLKYLDVRNTGLTNEECKQLEQLLPNVVIKFDKGCNCSK
jgi:leucine-rich repeat protein SHOC2